MLTRRFLTSIAALAFGLTATTGHAQDTYPSKPIRIVVPYPAGGSADSVARVFGEALGSKLGVTVIIDNKSGAAGTLGAESVLRAEPDGYTLLLTVTSQLSNAAVGVKPNYDAIKDFAPIVGISLAPMALAVPIASPAKSVKELEALAKTKPLAFGSYGIGSSGHVMLGNFSRSIGADMVHAPYRGEAPMVTDMLGGQIQLGLLTVGIAREMQNAGKMRLLATVGPTRSEFLPNLPTFSELGYRGFDWTYGIGLYASAKVPPAIFARLEKVGANVVAAPATQKRLRALSAEPWGASAAELKKRLVIDTVLWNKTLAQFGKLE